ncbi:hypothetical protein NDU88_002081 [Pleurodeles waltl]|uniref:Uncharacterized protein n=1 Tax=Pleurodeles waltl TaxID=8319 RepID=A0AAV7LZH2_PLEWA|nr:hypothetical protein NDU88_002081 [Pleurodeles waltl]
MVAVVGFLKAPTRRVFRCMSRRNTVICSMRSLKHRSDHEGGPRRVSDLQDGMMFYETGVLDDVNVVEQDEVLNHTRSETSGEFGHQDIERDKIQDVVWDKIQDTVQDESLNRYLPKRGYYQAQILG